MHGSQACALLFFTDRTDDCVSGMGKGKKRNTVNFNIVVANRIRRMEFLHCHIRGGMLQKFHSSFCFESIGIGDSGKEMSKTSGTVA